MLNRRRRVHTAWRYAPVVRWRCSSSCCCVLPLAFVGSACTASCSAACSELGAATRLAVTARRLRHERGSKIARPRDAVIIRLADDLGPLNLERDAIAYGPRQGIKCRASPTPIAQTHAPTCMGMAYAPPTERKDAPHSTATGPRGDHKVKYTLQAAAIGGAGALTCSSLGLILHAGHAARHGALPCAPRTHGGVHPCTAGVGGIDRRVHVTRENTKDRFAKYSVAVNPTHAPRATTVSFPSAIVGRATVRLYLIVHTAYEALFSARARGGGGGEYRRERTKWSFVSG